MEERILWINDYEKLVLGIDSASRENLVKGIQLKYDNMPEFFYKYREINDMTLNAFENDLL